MARQHERKPPDGNTAAKSTPNTPAPGKSSRTAALGAVQRSMGAGPQQDGDPQTVSDVASLAISHADAGAPVDRGVRRKVEAHLDADLSGVKVHQDELAQQSSAAMGARAFAHGSDVFLGPGESPADAHLMAHELTHVVQQRGASPRAQRNVAVGPADSPAEREADAVADKVSGNAPADRMIVDGDTQPAPGQMRRSEFLVKLRTQVTATADAALGPIWSAVGCPYIDQWFAKHANTSAQGLEALARRYSGVSQPASAADFFPPIMNKLRAGIAQWRSGGDVSGQLAASGMAGGAAVPTRTEMEQPDTDDGVALKRADGGQPLPATTASAMGDAFGENFGDVRVHTGPQAARAAASRDAAAFTVGSDITFNAGEYAPGSPEGDALLAHELAHVVQQRGAGQPAVQRKRRKGDEVAEQSSPALEADADQAAEGVLGRLYNGVAGAMRGVGSRVRPALSTSFGLQRCSTDEKKKAKAKAAAKPKPKPKPLGPGTAKGENSERFDSDRELEKVTSGKKSVGDGDKGHHVRKIQQALVDLGLLPPSGVTGTMDGPTKTAIKALQKKATLPQTGEVDSATMAALQQGFSEFKPYRDAAMNAGTTEADQLKGTRTLTDDDREAIEEAINPSASDFVAVPDGKGGVKYEPPKFKPVVNKVKYEDALEALLEKIATRQYNSMAKGKTDADRKDPTKLHDWKRYDDIGAVAKRETDVVFGDYKQGPPVAHGRVLFDRYEDQSKRIGKMTEDQKKGISQWRIQKMLNADDDVAALRSKYGALQSREKAIETTVRDKVAKHRHAEMLELHKNWPGSQRAGQIFLQRWKHQGKGADERNRKQMWGLFQTCIHEYLHLLTHSEFSKYASKHPYGHSLREGMTDLFTKTAWANVPVEKVRKDVEGPYYKAGGDVPNKNRYDATAQAEAIVGVVGIKNAMAAYFLGKTELIGKK